VRFPKPKILLIDLPPNSEKDLIAAGYNATTGTWGHPYPARNPNTTSPVRGTHSLPNYNEQEVIVCSLADIDKSEPSGKALDVFMIGSTHHVRPAVMRQFGNETSRILGHGGIIVLLTAPRTKHRYSLTDGSHLTLDNWALLPQLSEPFLKVETDPGHELSVEPSFLAPLLQRHLKGSSFSCHFEVQRPHAYPWIALAKNKYGHPVAAALPTTGDRKGWIILIPPPTDVPQFVFDLVARTLPNVAPHLFPDSSNVPWLAEASYELPDVIKLQVRIDEIRAQADNEVAALRRQIDDEHSRRGFLLDLLTASGTRLVKAIQLTLCEIGFAKVIDVDAESGGRELREDLQVDTHEGIILVEAKGIAGLPTDEDALQVTKYAAPRMRELGRTDVRCLSIINHQRNDPPLLRELDPFRDVVVHTAEANQCGLMTTWTLYRIARNYERLRWTHDQIAPLFRKDGVVAAIPSHYSTLGVVERRMEGVLGIRLADELRKGDRISVASGSDFHEQEAGSIQIDNQPVVRGDSGTLVGVATGWSKVNCGIGAIVYKVET
jgi:hypothetical protein